MMVPSSHKMAKLVTATEVPPAVHAIGQATWPNLRVRCSQIVP